MSIKNKVFEAIPKTWMKGYIYKKSDYTLYKANPIEDVNFSMWAKKSELWEKRLSTINGHEPAICVWLKKYLKPDDVFYDVGSLFGFFPMLVSTLQPGVEVHLFEPNWLNRKCAENNGQQSASTRPWKVNGGFVSSSNGPMIINDKFRDYYDKTAFTLDSYIASGRKVPTVMKMDIDGGEIEALKGMKDLLAARKTEMLIEVHPADLKKLGYDFPKEFMSMIPDDFHKVYLPNLREDNTVWKNEITEAELREEFYLYCAPKESARFKL